MSNIVGKQPSNTNKTIYLSDNMPLDAKMRTETMATFQELPANSKWNGMLVYVDDVGKWYEYDQGSDTLVLFQTGGGSGGNSSLIVPNGKMIVWKYPNNVDLDNLELNDIIEGFIEGKLIKGRYKTGASNLLTSFELLEETNINV